MRDGAALLVREYLDNVTAPLKELQGHDLDHYTFSRGTASTT